MPLATIPLVLGAGLDRATGTAAVQPTVAVDAENWYARDAKLAVRPGLVGTGYPALPWGTDVACIAPCRATGEVMYVLYDRTSREVRIYRLNPALGTLTPAGVDGAWGTLSPDALWPVVTAAENDGKVFFAHDEPTLAYRLATIYYTPDLDNPLLPGALTTLEADLDGDGTAAPVYFRGVIAYLEYMCGWGYGSEQVGEEDRGDIFRVSQPAEPTVFRPESFAVCGARREPITAAVPTEGVLAIAKATEAYRLVGTSPLDFRIEVLDSRYGAVSSRSAVAVGNVGFWCSSDGPRLVLAGSTEPVAQSLELVSPLPDTLPARGPNRTCFVVYDRDRYTLEWLWPNLDTVALRTTGFLLSRWDPQRPRWTFTVREQCVSCAGEVIFSEAVAVAVLDGYVSNVVATDTAIAADARYRRVEISWDNNLALGNETVQIFTKPAGGAWSIALSVPVASTTAQSAAVDIALPLTEYDIAIRYTRLGGVTAGYEGNDPDAWTAPTEAGAKTTVTTTSASVAWTGGSFVNASTPVTLTWSSAQLNAPYLLEKDAGAGWVTVAADLVATSYVYTIPSGELGTTVDFRVRAQRGVTAGPSAGTRSVPMFITIAAPAWLSATWQDFNGVAALSWTAVTGATNYELQVSLDGGATWLSFASTASTSFNPSLPTSYYNTTVNFRVRATASGSVSAWAGPQPLVTTVIVGSPTLSTIQWQYWYANSSAYFTPSPIANWGLVAVVVPTITNASSFRIEESADGVSGWTSVTTVGGGAGVGYVVVPYAGLNTTRYYRAVGMRTGAADGAPSNVLSVARTATIDSTAPVYSGSAFTWSGPSTGLMFFDINGVFLGSVSGVSSPYTPTIGVGGWSASVKRVTTRNPTGNFAGLEAPSSPVGTV